MKCISIVRNRSDDKITLQITYITIALIGGFGMIDIESSRKSRLLFTLVFGIGFVGFTFVRINLPLEVIE